METKEANRKTDVLIPAYKPLKELIEITNTLVNEGFGVVVVNDGSGDEYDVVFGALNQNVVILNHEVNRGKGAALRTGFTYIKENRPDTAVVVTADADGQHTQEDIIRVAEASFERPDAFVLGSRFFEGKMPLTSKIGNTLTRWVYAAATRVKVTDTQTGLRAFSRGNLDFMAAIEGDRYEYEMNALMEAAKAKIPIIEVKIKTVYINDNASSHFHPLRDSFLIYKQIFKFAASSIISFLIDFAMLLVFKKISAPLGEELSLLVSIIGARVISSACNFIINKKIVFKHERSAASSALKYYALALVILAANYALMYLTNIVLGIPLALAKIIVETVLFIASYSVQKKVIFKN